MKRNFFSEWVKICLGVGMSISLIYGALYLIGIPGKYMLVAIATIIGYIIWCLVLKNFYTFIAGVGSIGLIGAATILLKNHEKWTSSIEQLGQYIKANGLELGITLGITLVVYILTQKYFNKVLLMMVGVCLYGFIIFWEKDFNGVGLMLFVIIALLYFFYDYYLKLLDEAEESRKMKMSYSKITSLICGLTFVLTVFSASTAPIKFTVLHRLLDKKESGEHKDAYTKYYPYKGKLGGDIVLGNEEVLEVTTTKSTYFKADTKSIYRGSYWTNEEENPVVKSIGEYQFLDTLEMIQGMRLLSNASEDRLYRDQLYRIKFKDILTQSLFIPTKSSNLAVSQEVKEFYQIHEDNLYMGSAFGKGFTYSVHGYTPQYNTEEFKEAIRKSKKGLYAEYRKIGDTSVLTREELGKWMIRAEEIQEAYTQLPNTLPERVRELAYEITKDYENAYDKVRAIESYLASQYTYTLTPGENNARKDFVDTFLFEKKEGYCTYFATAMAVLARCIDLPSRYVEGYVTPAVYQQGTSTYMITNKQAHAWVEVYFEGFGWMLFEPTPAYQGVLRQRYVGTTDPYYPEMESIELEDTKINNPQPQSPVIKSYSKLKGIMGMLVSAILIILGSIIFVRRMEKDKLLPREYILEEYSNGLTRLAMKGLKVEEGETELIFAKRVDERLCTNVFEEMTKLYLRAKYSNQDMTQEQKEKMRGLHTSLRKILK